MNILCNNLFVTNRVIEHNVILMRYLCWTFTYLVGYLSRRMSLILSLLPLLLSPFVVRLTDWTVEHFDWTLARTASPLRLMCSHWTNCFFNLVFASIERWCSRSTRRLNMRSNDIFESYQSTLSTFVGVQTTGVVDTFCRRLAWLWVKVLWVRAQ